MSVQSLVRADSPHREISCDAAMVEIKPAPTNKLSADVNGMSFHILCIICGPKETSVQGDTPQPEYTVTRVAVATSL